MITNSETVTESRWWFVVLKCHHKLINQVKTGKYGGDCSIPVMYLHYFCSTIFSLYENLYGIYVCVIRFCASKRNNCTISFRMHDQPTNTFLSSTAYRKLLPL